MSQSSLSDLVKQTKSENPRERRSAYQGLADSGDPRVIPHLINAYAKDDDDKVRDITYDGLAAFKALQQGQTSRRLPVSDDTLKKLLGGLAALFVITLMLNGILRLVGGSGDDTDSPRAIAQTEPSDRDELVALLSDNLAEVEAIVATLRGEIEVYDTTGAIECDFDQTAPQPVMLGELDQFMYRDLAIVNNRLVASLGNIGIAELRWRHFCRIDAPNAQDKLDASARLDQAENQLAETRSLLQTAIDNPAPTPAPTSTAGPQDAAQPADSNTDANGDDASTDSATDIPQPTETPEPTETPTPSGPVEYPDLDYAEILNELADQFVIEPELQNPYATGMIGQWQRAQVTDGPSSTTGCVLNDWPDPFSLTPEQQALLDQPGFGDPELEQLLLLLNEAYGAARQARNLFERDCPTGELANSAQEGIQLAEGAIARLNSVRELMEIIRQRPDSP